MSPWLWLGIWLACVVASVATHELAHVVTALKAGWTYNGMTFKWYVAGVGVKLEPTQEQHGRQLAAIAVMGPVSSFAAAAIFLILANGVENPYAQTVFASLYALNVAIAVVNLIPTPITDGGHILKGLFGWTMKWRYVAVAWVLAELVAVWILFF